LCKFTFDRANCISLQARFFEEAPSQAEDEEKKKKSEEHIKDLEQMIKNSTRFYEKYLQVKQDLLQ
jgi:hypothetical protein